MLAHRGGKMIVQDEANVREFLDYLPDVFSTEEMSNHSYVPQSVDYSQADAIGGQTIFHQEVARRLRKK